MSMHILKIHNLLLLHKAEIHHKIAVEKHNFLAIFFAVFLFLGNTLGMLVFLFFRNTLDMF